MTEAQIQARMAAIEKYLTEQQITSTHAIALAGEWKGLGRTLDPNCEGAWSLLTRTQGF